MRKMYLFKFSLQYGGGIRGDDDSLAIYGQIKKKKKKKTLEGFKMEKKPKLKQMYFRNPLFVPPKIHPHTKQIKSRCEASINI